VHGTPEDARALINLITQVQYRTYQQAAEVIAPYIELRRLGSSQLCRVITQPIPSRDFAKEARRTQVERDYYRIKLLDTIAKLCRELENYECEGDGVGVDTTAIRP
jgi:hypothetical protein